VLASGTSSPIDIDARLRALTTFLALPASASLAAANKRIANILRKAESDTPRLEVNRESLTETPEQQLFDHYTSIEPAVNAAFDERRYEDALTKLSSLRDDVDRFFDKVMVMADDPVVRANRLALLARIRGLFLRGVDLSKLPG